MTLTHNETAQHDAADVRTTQQSGLLGRLAAVPATGDHKAIGKLWIGAGLGYGLLMLLVGALVAIERAIDTSQVDLTGLIQGFESYAQYWTMYRFGLLFLVVLPLIVGLATYIVPLQVGSTAIAFPRAANAAFWTWLISSGIFVVSFAVDGGFVAGGEIDAVNLSLSSFFFILASFLVAAMTLATTVITQRCEGMWLERTPMFAWSVLVASAVWLLSLPVLMANLVVIWIDHQGNLAIEYGVGANMYGQLAWVFDQPQVFAFLIPVIGMVADIMPTGFSARPRLHAVSQGAIAFFGLVSFGAYAQPFFSPNALTSPVYVLGALGLLAPLLIIGGGWGDMAGRGGAPKLGVHLLVALDAVLLVGAAAAIAVVRILNPLIAPVSEVDELDLAGTTAATGLFTAAMGAGLVGALAGLHYWGPKLFGRKLNGGLTMLAALSLVGGTLLSAVPDVISGFMDQNDNAVAMAASGRSVDSTVEAMNWISMAGQLGMLAGTALIVLNLLGSLGRTVDEDYWDDADPDNPHGGFTLEWATTSPPPLGNFAAPVVVSSEFPVLDAAGDDS